MKHRGRRTLYGFVAALPIAFGCWTYYVNTIGSCSIDAGSPLAASAAPGASRSSRALSATGARALTAYGGDAVWQGARATETTVTIGGALFWVKGRTIPPHAVIRADLRRPHVEISPVDAAGDVGTLDGFAVTITSPGGQTIDHRPDARDHLRNQQLWTRWDRLDLTYFLAYAFWGYNSLPYQLTRSDITWTEIEDGVLQADYGADVPVHNRSQRFFFDRRTGLLRRNDYNALAASPGAQAANVVLAHGLTGDVPFPSRREVKMTPHRYGWCVPAPNMVTIDVEKWRVY
jgi:hypothetical protein